MNAVRTPKRGRPRKSGKVTKVRLDLDNYQALPRDGSDERNQLINTAVRDFLKKERIS